VKEVSARADLEVCIDDVRGGGTGPVQLDLILHPTGILGCNWNQLQPVCCCVVCLHQIMSRIKMHDCVLVECFLVFASAHLNV